MALASDKCNVRLGAIQACLAHGRRRVQNIGGLECEDFVKTRLADPVSHQRERRVIEEHGLPIWRSGVIVVGPGKSHRRQRQDSAGREFVDDLAGRAIEHEQTAAGRGHDDADLAGAQEVARHGGQQRVLAKVLAPNDRPVVGVQSRNAAGNIDLKDLQSPVQIQIESHRGGGGLIADGLAPQRLGPRLLALVLTGKPQGYHNQPAANGEAPADPGEMRLVKSEWPHEFQCSSPITVPGGRAHHNWQGQRLFPPTKMFGSPSYSPGQFGRENHFKTFGFQYRCSFLEYHQENS